MRNRKTKGGGILIALKDDSEIEMIATHISETQEQMWIKVNENIIALAYGLIETRAEEREVEEWYYELEKEYVKWMEANVMIIGDINAHIGNDESGIEGNHSNVSNGGRILRNLAERRNLTVMNNSDVCEGLWTREDANGSKSVLDLIIANQPMVNRIKKIKIDEDHIYKLSSLRKVNEKYQENKSDHNTILIEIEDEKKKDESTRATKSKQWNIKSEEAWEKYRHN